MSPSGFRAASRFHLDTGVRIVLGLGPLQLVTFVVVLAMLPQPLEALRLAARGVTDGTLFPGAGIALAGMALATVIFAARRILPGARGWTLHLPVSETGQRRALLSALLVSQVLLAMAWIGFTIGGLSLDVPVHVPSLLAMPLILLSAAYVVLPYSRRWPRTAAALALMLSTWGNWPSILVAAASLLIVERNAHLSLVNTATRRQITRIRRPDTLLARVSWTALGPGIATVFLEASLPIAVTFLVLRNNPDITPMELGVTVRGGFGLGVMLIVLSLSGRLVLRRPPWAWSRSLAWSARTRIGHDAAFLALHALPIVLTAALLNLRDAVAISGLGLYLALRAAGAMRSMAPGMTRLGWKMTVEGIVAVILVAASAWWAWGFLALAPLALYVSRNRERALKVSVIRERQYVASGDPTC